VSHEPDLARLAGTLAMAGLRFADAEHLTNRAAFGAALETQRAA